MYSTSMSKAPYSPSVLVIMIGVLIMTLSFDVSAQPTVDDEVYCQSSTSDETVKQIRADVRQVKNLLESRQFSATDSSSLCKCFARRPYVYCNVARPVESHSDAREPLLTGWCLGRWHSPLRIKSLNSASGSGAFWCTLYTIYVAN